MDNNSEDQLDVDTITINVPEIDLSSLNYTIDMSSSSYYYGNVTLSGAQGASGAFLTSAGANGTSWNTIASNPGLDVRGDATFEGDIKWKGRSLEKLLRSIEDRLAILQDPNPEKLEKYAALKKAYDHYKTLERLIGED